jgi:hypothetical protein
MKKKKGKKKKKKKETKHDGIYSGGGGGQQQLAFIHFLGSSNLHFHQPLLNVDLYYSSGAH